MMALGTLFYLIGFGMFGVVSAYWLFVLAVVIITVGEMIVMPTSQALAAGFARTDMRGRYMAVFGLSIERAGRGRSAGGRIGARQLQSESPLVSRRVLCAPISATGFYALHVRLGAQSRVRRRAPARIEDASMAMEAEHG